MNLLSENALKPGTIINLPVVLCILTLGLLSTTAHAQDMSWEDDVCINVCRDDLDYDSASTCLYDCFNRLAILANQEEADETGSYERSSDDNDVINDAEKRKSNFVRIGRQKSSFVRIGRSVDKRPSSFVRIGKSDPNLMSSDDSSLEDAFSKRASSFVRIGRGGNQRALYKRPSSFVRIGKKSDPLERVWAQKRPSSFVRIGKSLPVPEESKRASAFVRIGRPSSFVRIGKKDDPSYKRASSFVRIGKKDMYDSGNQDNLPEAFETSDLYAALPDDLYITDDAQKRASSFVRIGKSSVGNNDESEATPTDDINKRTSSFVRIGKSTPYNDKRASNFVRIGKRSGQTGMGEEVAEGAEPAAESSQ